MTDLVKMLREEIIADAFERGSITDGRLAERLIRERIGAADRLEALVAEVERLRARLTHAEDDCEDDCIYCEERRQEIARARAALGEKQ